MRVPFGDFFGIGHATCKHFVSLPLSMVFGGAAGTRRPLCCRMNSYFPMPFGSHVKIQIINESEEAIKNLFYYVDYELYQDAPPEDLGRFHACWNREASCEKIVHPSDLKDLAPWDLPGVLTGKAITRFWT